MIVSNVGMCVVAVCDDRNFVCGLSLFQTIASFDHAKKVPPQIPSVGSQPLAKVFPYFVVDTYKACKIVTYPPKFHRPAVNLLQKYFPLVHGIPGNPNNKIV